ncbi:MAG TPA: hypothetical protein VNL18_12915 [Gemmatimonadales bacterium]|nr:hypothetical protein [Gemmatimonadales bacterium]
MMRSSRIPFGVLLGLLGVVAPAIPQSPDWNAFLTVRPDPSPYIADWESDPSVVTLVLSYTGSINVAFHLNGTILRGTSPILSGRSTEFEFVRPSQLLLTTRDGIWESSSVTYESELRDQLIRTGRIPDGDYKFCVDVRQGTSESPGTTLTQACADFSITAPAPPSLVAPSDGDTTTMSLPLFAWTPVVTGINAPVTYHLRIVEVLPGQTPLEAINNLPHEEADLGVTSFLYSPTALALRDGAVYAWQVQALDAAGQPFGERQGKSEVWTFYHGPGLPPIVAVPDSTPADSTEEEQVVSRFDWAGVEIRVLSLSDSSRSNYTGRGRAKIIPGVFEPAFRFRSVRLTEDLRRVDYAPRHRLRVPSDDNLYDWSRLLNAVATVPVGVMLTHIELVADSATGDRYVGLQGDLIVRLPLEGEAAPIPEAEAKQYAEQQAAYDASLQQCMDKTIAALEAEEAAGEEEPDVLAAWDEQCDELEPPSAPKPSWWAQLRADYESTKRQLLHFRFRDVRVGPDGPEGSLTLAQRWTSKEISANQFKMTLYQDSTRLVVADGVGTLDIKGDFTIPPSSGLRLSEPVKRDLDPDDPDNPLVLDSAITVPITRARLGTGGEFYLAVAGIPLAKIGETSLKLQTGEAVVDLSGDLSPEGRPASWRGVYLDSARVFLPEDWSFGNIDPFVQGVMSPVSISGHRLVLDDAGFSGDVAASGLSRLGPVSFGGFQGTLDSLRFVINQSTLDTGFVEGYLNVPFLSSQIAYHALFSPVGFERAYARLTSQEAIAMPALQSRVVIQRGEFNYERPIGTFTMDAKLTVDQEGISLRDVQVYGLSISNDGGIKLQKSWITFDAASEANFKNFPVALDSIGFGSGQDGNEVWLGLAGRFSLSDNLPSGKGAFRFFARRERPGAAWAFHRLAVDKLDVSYENAAVRFRGQMDYMEDDPVYGDGFKAGLRMRVQDQFDVDGTFIAGATSFRYWYVDAALRLPPPGIQLGTLPLSLYGFGGGAFSRMRANIDTITLKATYVPDQSTMFGLKALVSLGTSANAGYVWNADATLEATAAASGGLQSLTLRGDNWMLTDVSRREEKIWGTVFMDLPVSRPVFHANLTLNVDLKPAMTGNGWAELHFDPDSWYVNIGTPSRPDSLTLLPGTLNLRSAAHFHMDDDGVAAGFATELEKEKRVGAFYGRVAAGYEANAELRYRPFRAAGDGELWGEIVAKVKAAGTWYELLSGTARATMAFEFPDPTWIKGRIKVKYKLAGGAVKGTYKMRYSWGSGDDAAADTTQFVIIAATSPLPNDTGASVNGISYYLGLSEGVEYGTDGGVYRLRLSATPVIGKRTVTQLSLRDPRTGRVSISSAVTWPSIGTPQRVWDEERQTLALVGPGYAPLAAGATYRSIVQFTLEKQTDGGWQTQQVVSDTLVFTTSGATPILAQFVTGSDPRGGASPLYYGGPNGGAVRVKFSNTHPDLTSRAAVGRVVANGTDTVAGNWGTSSYTLATRLTGDPTIYAFTPGGGALAPSTTYRLALVQNDTTAREHWAVSFVTSRYASFAEHMGAETPVVEPTRGPGPVSGTGNYLLKVRVVLPSLEAMQWDDIDSVEVTGVTAGWQVTPRTRCRAMSPTVGIDMRGMTVGKLCGATPTFENILDVQFTAESDASLPAAGTTSLTLRLNHRREGWHTFTYAIPATLAAGVTNVTGAVTQPTTTLTTTTVTAPTIDVTKVRRP